MNETMTSPAQIRALEHTLSPEQRAALSAIGRIGGRMGVGACKVRSYSKCKKAANARWSKYRRAKAKELREAAP